MTAARRLVRALAAVVTTLTATAIVWAPTPASATTYYEYWGYWHKASGAGPWQYSKVGPGSYYLPKGSSVEGWRFAVGTAGPSDPQPRPTGATYDSYCGSKNASATYRVLLVVDYGTGSGAPSGPVYSCYGFNDSTTGSQVLTQQHSVRDSGGLICAIDGYPKSGCGETVASPAPTHSAAPRPARSTSTKQPTGTTVKHRPQAGSGARPSRAGGLTATTAPTSPAAPSASTAPTPRATRLATSAATQPGTSTATTPAAQQSAVPFAGAPAGKSSAAGDVALAGGVAAIVLLGGGAFLRSRRSRGRGGAHAR